MAELYFDASQIPEQSFDPLPAGDYLVWVTESDIETDQQGTQRIEVTMETIEPKQYENRKLWDSFTLESPTNPSWAETGRKILATLCRAVGVMAPRDTHELHGVPFFARVIVDTWNDGSLHNKVVARWSTSSQAPPQKKGKAATPAPRAPQAGHQTGYMPPQRPQAPAAPQYQAPQQPQYTNPLYPQNHPAQQPQASRPAVPPPGAPYPGQGGQPSQNWQPPAQPPAQQYQAPQQAYQPPPGPPAWAQQPQQPAAPQDPYHSSITGGDEVPF